MTSESAQLSADIGPATTDTQLSRGVLFHIPSTKQNKEAHVRAGEPIPVVVG